MLLKKYYNNFYTNGYTIVKNLISKNEALELLEKVALIKNKVSNKKQQYFHKTKDGSFNTIHNIQHFIKKGKIGKDLPSLFFGYYSVCFCSHFISHLNQNLFLQYMVLLNVKDMQERLLRLHSLEKCQQHRVSSIAYLDQV